MGIYIALGANRDSVFDSVRRSPGDTFNKALLELTNQGVQVKAISSLWKSPAWPDPKKQPPYVNAVVKITTKLGPIDLLHVLKDTELAFGRFKTARNAPRPLDLDILDYESQIRKTDRLELPHPRLCARPFVLFPLFEIAPSWRDPVRKRAIPGWIARLAYAEVEALERIGRLTP